MALAGYPIGLGSLAVCDLPQVEHHYILEKFLDGNRSGAATVARMQIRSEQDDN